MGRPSFARTALISALAASSLTALPTTAHAASTTIEAETLQPRNQAATIIARPSASAGRALQLTSHTRAVRTVNLPASARLAVRARGLACHGAPQLRIKLNGRSALTRKIRKSSWTTYNARVILPAGNHTINLKYTNDHRTRSCDRRLEIDTLRFVTIKTKTANVASQAATPGSVKFNGDFETGNLAQWSSVQSVAADRFAPTTNLVRQGRYSARVQINGGDPLLHTGQRSEVLWGSDNNLTLRNGDEYYFGWSTYFANDFPSPTNGGHCLFIQWKNGGTGSPPLDLHCKDNKIQFNYSAKCGGWNTPLVRGGWNDFVARIKFSPDANTGYVELWHKAPNEAAMTKKVNHCNTNTLNNNINSYLKLGYYRRNDETRTGTLHHDALKVGTSYNAVAPN